MSAIQLRAPVNTGNRYCGPAAISAIAGIGTAEAARLIRLINPRRKSVKGTHDWEIRKALGKLGVRSWPVSIDGKPTLAGWLKASKAIRTTGRTFLVSAGHHWQVISGRRYVCGRVREVVSIRDDRVKRRARVADVYELAADLAVQITAKDLEPKNVQIDPARRAAKKLAKLIGAELDTDSDGIGFVYAPEGIAEEVDPYEGNHYADDWDDVLKRLQAYRDLTLASA